ncbi:effector-associated domain 2-containing protein [Actinosynnema sp. CA-299493]
MVSAAVHRSFVVVDVESYGDPTRTSPQRTAVRDGMYRVLMTAFADCDLPWDDEAVDDAGDSVMVLLPADVPKSVLVERLPERVVAALRRHNHVHAHEARLRMRMAVHAGEVHYDERGKTSAEMIFTYRILDAPAAKQSLKSSTATLVLVVSDPFYRSVVRHDPAARPGDYTSAQATVKEVDARVWVRLVDGRPIAGDATTPIRAVVEPPLTLAELGPIVDVLLRTPGFDTREGRDLVLREVKFAAAIGRHSANRPDTVSIVRTCAHYPGGLKALLEAIRFYAAGSTEMAELDTLLAERISGV